MELIQKIKNKKPDFRDFREQQVSLIKNQDKEINQSKEINQNIYK